MQLSASGSLVITEDGATVDAKKINGTVTVRADNVTIKRSLIESTGRYAIQIDGGYKNLVVEDTEIDGNGVTTIAILRGEYTLRRVNIHDVRDGPRIEGNNVVIEDSYIHHLYRVTGGHHDAIQLRKGSNIAIVGSSLQAYNPTTGDPMNAAIQFGSFLAPVTNMRVEHNLMNGGNYTVNGGRFDGSNVVISNNTFGRDFRYGVRSGGGAGLTWGPGNVYVDGTPIP